MWTDTKQLYSWLHFVTWYYSNQRCKDMGSNCLLLNSVSFYWHPAKLFHVQYSVVGSTQVGYLCYTSSALSSVCIVARCCICTIQNIFIRIFSWTTKQQQLVREVWQNVCTTLCINKIITQHLLASAITRPWLRLSLVLYFACSPLKWVITTNMHDMLGHHVVIGDIHMNGIIWLRHDIL